MTTPTPEEPDGTDASGVPRAPAGSTRGESFRYALASVMIAGVVGYLMFGAHKGIGIFAALVAVVLTRLLILGTGEPSREGKE